VISGLKKHDRDTEARAERRLRLWLMALSPNTAAAYSVDLQLFESYVAAHELSGAAVAVRPFCWFVSLSPSYSLEVVERWQMRMMAAGLASATINRRTTAINAALRHLAKANIGPGKLDIDQVRQDCRREIEAPSACVVSRVVKDLSVSTAPADIRDTMILLLAGQRGLRRSEIAGLTIDAVADDTVSVRVKRKGHREKTPLVLESACSEALRRWLAIRSDHARSGEMALIVGLGNRGRGTAISGQSIYNIIKLRGGWHPHQLRHSAIEEALRATGNNVALAQALAGHTTVSTTMVYVSRAARKRLEREAVAAMSGAYRLAKQEQQDD
jgi:site-specific recombinase XerC